ncbi:hypothetical protein [Rhodococcus oxybenzonivorans]|uniref:hypothetical protein n=1 Tax=Rhodococcus oxybenzonivorans TaxID=1990687 RepID=UPI0037C7DBAF
MYAYGSDAFDREAVHALLAAQQRNSDNPASVWWEAWKIWTGWWHPCSTGAPTDPHVLARRLVVGSAGRGHLPDDLGRTRETITTRMPRHPGRPETARGGPCHTAERHQQPLASMTRQAPTQQHSARRS